MFSQFQQFNCEEVAVPSFESLPLGLRCIRKNFRWFQQML